MSLKKVLIISIVTILLTVVGYFGYLVNKYFALEEKYVSLVYDMETRIVLVNVGNGDRDYISRKIDEVANCSPLIVGLDIFFEQYTEDSPTDSLLLSSIINAKVITGTRHSGVGTHGVHTTFLNACENYGFAEISMDKNGYATKFDVFFDVKSKRDYHFAYVLASMIDHGAASRFLDSLEGTKSDIVISRLRDQFKIFDLDEKITCEDVSGKTVLFGYLGPADEDKFYTYSRFSTSDDKNGPDMYGLIIVANQVLMILDY